MHYGYQSMHGFLFLKKNHAFFKFSFQISDLYAYRIQSNRNGKDLGGLVAEPSSMHDEDETSGSIQVNVQKQIKPLDVIFWEKTNPIFWIPTELGDTVEAILSGFLC